MSKHLKIPLKYLALFCLTLPLLCRAADTANCSISLKVTSELTYPRTPMDPEMDFADLIQTAGIPGKLNPNSIRVINKTTGQIVPCALEGFEYRDKGRVEWVITDPTHTDYEIQFQVGPHRPIVAPKAYTPLIGTGDLLRYNRGAPSPTSGGFILSRMIDMNNDGKLDLLGTRMYGYRPGEPWGGVVFLPGTGDLKNMTFGDLVRIRYVKEKSSRDFLHWDYRYMAADAEDLNQDGLPDLVVSERKPKRAGILQLYLNTGERDDGNVPIFVESGSLERPVDWWGPVRL